MRTITYAVINKDTNEIYKTGCKIENAEKKMNELKKANPTANFVISHRWMSI